MIRKAPWSAVVLSVLLFTAGCASAGDSGPGDTPLRVLVYNIHAGRDAAGGSYEPRGALHAVIATPGGDLHVLNTHLDPSATNEYRLQEAAALADRAEALRTSGVPVLIGGDLNTTPGGAALVLGSDASDHLPVLFQLLIH